MLLLTKIYFLVLCLGACFILQKFKRFQENIPANNYLFKVAIETIEKIVNNRKNC